MRGFLFWKKKKKFQHAKMNVRCVLLSDRKVSWSRMFIHLYAPSMSSMRVTVTWRFAQIHSMTIRESIGAAVTSLITAYASVDVLFWRVPDSVQFQYRTFLLQWSGLYQQPLIITQKDLRKYQSLIVTWISLLIKWISSAPAVFRKEIRGSAMVTHPLHLSAAGICSSAPAD